MLHGRAMTLGVDCVAVIGAGPSGLAAAKYLLAEKKFSKIEIFEQRNAVGGIWVYTPGGVGDDSLTVPKTERTTRPDKVAHVEGLDAAQFVSPVYDLLETNIPHTLMNYSDRRFPDETPLFPPHQVVRNYLEEYAHGLEPLLSRSTQVLSVRKIHAGGHNVWELESIDLKTNTTRKSLFDAVMVASGHYNDPFIPDITGIAEFDKTYPGSISHSKFYRNPGQYKDKKVVIVGNSASGIDVSSQISEVCKLPIIVSEKRIASTPFEDYTWAKNVPEIVAFQTEDRAVRFADGEVETDIDAVLFCTGYFYSFPFLKDLSPPVTTDGSHAQHLYEHVIYREDPTLAFVGVLQRVVPFPIAESQSAWVARLWADRLCLPSDADMRAWNSRMLEEHGMGKALHNLPFPKDVDYINKLHGWSMSARRVSGLENEGAGKIPPYWDAEIAWVRERFPMIKIAARKFGEKKHQIRSVAELGFDYGAWRSGQMIEEKFL